MKSISVLLLLMIPFLMPAQNQNEKARLQLQKLSGQIKTYKNVRIEFTYTLDNKEAKIHENRQGTMWLSGNRYRLTIAGQIIVNDGKALYTYLPEAKEIQINEVSDQDDNLSPLAILSNYEKKYKIKYIREDKPSQMVVDLVPVEGKKFFKIRIEIDTKKNQLSAFSLHDRNGSVYSYQITRFDSDNELKPGFFTINTADYPGVEVVDMR